MSSDFMVASVLLSLAGVITFAYYLRVKIKGRQRNARIDAYGGSSLLNKSVIEGAYWFFQPFSRLLAFMRVTPNKVSFGSLFNSLDGQVARLYAIYSDVKKRDLAETEAKRALRVTSSSGLSDEDDSIHPSYKPS